MLHEIAFIVFGSCLFIAFLMLIVSQKIPNTRKGIRKFILRNWVKVNFSDHLTTVQALRNLTMVNGAITSALLVLVGILIGLYPTIFTKGDFFQNEQIPLELVQLITIVLIVGISLISFINSSRMAVNLSFLMTAYSKEPLEEIDNEEKQFINSLFNRLQWSWMLGVRGLFFLIVVITWLIEPTFLLISSICITLYIIIFQDLDWFNLRKKSKEYK